VLVLVLKHFYKYLKSVSSFWINAWPMTGLQATLYISSNNFSASVVKLTVTATPFTLDLRTIKKQTDLFTTFKNHIFKWSSLVLWHVYMYCTLFNQNWMMLLTENQTINNHLLNSVSTTVWFYINHKEEVWNFEVWNNWRNTGLLLRRVLHMLIDRF